MIEMERVKPSKLKWLDTGNGYLRKVLMRVENKAGKACKVQFIWIPPNTTVKPHYHKGQTESEYVLKGSGSVKCAGQVVRLRPGVLFTVAPDEAHVVKSGSKGLLLFVTKANYSDDTEWMEN